MFDGDLGRVIFNELDLTTFRSSLSRKIDERTKTFQALKNEHSHSNMQVTVKPANGEFEFILLGRGDYNSDGNEGLMVIFVDQALTSSY